MDVQTKLAHEDGIILYDGDCVLCSRWVKFVAVRDSEGLFRFTPITSPYGRELAGRLGIDAENPDTNAVFLNGAAHTYSSAALTVLSNLPHWRWARALFFVPSVIRDNFYKVVARNRFRIFGRVDACTIPSPDIRRRIVTETPTP
jgi:predicted DCC family thiol-disulfide oxidoreductase YuxK